MKINDDGLSYIEDYRCGKLQANKDDCQAAYAAM